MLMQHNKISRLQKKQSKYFLRFKYANYFFTLLFLCGGVYVFYLFYNIIFSVLSGAEQVSQLRATLSIEAINFTKYDEVNAAWDTRLNTDLPESAYDPFSASNIFLQTEPLHEVLPTTTFQNVFSTSTLETNIPIPLLDVLPNSDIHSGDPTTEVSPQI